jgi:hypothetical protein
MLLTKVALRKTRRQNWISNNDLYLNVNTETSDSGKLKELLYEQIAKREYKFIWHTTKDMIYNYR